MNKFESSKPEISHEGLIEYYENLVVQERAKEKVEHGPHVEELEEMLVPLLREEVLGPLNVITTEEAALNSEERADAKKALIPVVDKLKFLDRRTNITEEELERLRKKYRIVSNAVGMINGGKVDRNR